MEQKYRAVKDYQIKIDYDIYELINIVKNNLQYKNEIIDDFDDFDDFKKNTALMGARTTLGNELKVLDTEALNYLMGFPLNFDLEFFVDILSDRLFNNLEMDRSAYIDKIKYLIDRKTETTEVGNFARLKFDFDKKQKLIERNFESTTHIDVQEFLAWAESKSFIEKNLVDYDAIY